VADRENVDGIIAFGVLMEGQTAHAQLISSAVTDALMRISLSRQIPVVHEVLVLQSEAQAKARCLEDDVNRGTEAARVAIRMAEVMNQFQRRQNR
jgi:6,7-dimethyl-8-ribityllumazine synthase